jgi:hypothetical protein
VSYHFDKAHVAAFHEKLKVAMLKSEYIDYIKNGFISEPRTDLERQMSDNAFIFEEPVSRTFLYGKAKLVKTKNGLPVESQVNIVITATMASAGSLSKNSAPPDTIENGDEIKSFFRIIRNMSYKDIALVKSQVTEVLLDNDIMVYVGDSIATGLVPSDRNYGNDMGYGLRFSASTINEYNKYTYIKMADLQSIRSWKSSYLYVAFATLIFGIFICHVLLALTLQLKFNYVNLNRSPWGVFLIASFLYGIVMPTLIGYVFFYSLVSDFYSNLSPVICVIAVGFLVILFMYFLMARRASYTRHHFNVFLINYLLLPLLLVVAAYLVFSKLTGAEKIEMGWLICSSALLLLPVLDYILIGKCHLLANMPD